eukprot:4700040-Pyramimonas_sp.AAC.1
MDLGPKQLGGERPRRENSSGHTTPDSGPQTGQPRNKADRRPLPFVALASPPLDSARPTST